MDAVHNMRSMVSVYLFMTASGGRTVTDTDTVSTKGYYVAGIGLHRPCRISDTSGDSEGAPDKVFKGEFIIGPSPLFITSCPEAEGIRRLTGALTG